MKSDITRKLLAPISIEEFFQVHWETELLHVRRKVSDCYNDILTIDHLDSYFRNRNLSPHFLRVLKAGIDYELSRWTNLEHRSHTDPARVVAVDKLFELFCQGATVIMIAAQTGIPTLNAFCNSLSRELKIRVQPNVYITPAGEQGFTAHYDPHDIFVLQISGTKQWKLYDQSEKLPVRARLLESEYYEDKEPKCVVDLQPGDLLYLPRGTVHVAQSANRSSVHVTIGLLGRYWFNLIKDLAIIAEEDSAFRRALPHGLSTPQEKANFVEEFDALLRDLLARNPVESLLDRSQFVAPAADNFARLNDLLRIEQLTTDSTVSVTPDINYELEYKDNAFIIKFGNERVSLPGFMKVSFESLLGAEPKAVSDVVGPLPDKSKLELVTTLVQAGFLRIHSI